MNLLFDFITLCDQTGTGVYTRRIFFELMKQEVVSKHELIKVFALFDSRRGIAYSDMTSEQLSKNYNITFIDILEYSKLESIIKEYKINKFFIACAQYVGVYPSISEIGCEVICVTHDLCFEEWYQNNLNFYFFQLQIGFKWPTINDKLRSYLLKPRNNVTRFFLWAIRELFKHSSECLTHLMHPVVELANRNKNTQLIAVSEYTKTSLFYNYGLYETVKVLWSPERVISKPENPQNLALRDILESKLKYVLMVSSNRSYKNGLKVLDAFERFSRLYDDFYIVTVGFGRAIFSNHIDLDYLSDGDLSVVMANCHSLIYPSFFEGFGYPPLEAMRFNKPVLISNTTSLPEIFGDAPIYFSPLYETSIFDALLKLVKADYTILSEKSKERYNYIHKRQERDLQELIEMIIAPSSCSM